MVLYQGEPKTEKELCRNMYSPRQNDEGETRADKYGFYSALCIHLLLVLTCSTELDSGIRYLLVNVRSNLLVIPGQNRKKEEGSVEKKIGHKDKM